MDIKEFTITLDEYVVVDPVDGFCYFWSKSEFEANLFYKVNCSLRASLIHVSCISILNGCGADQENRL